MVSICALKRPSIYRWEISYTEGDAHSREIEDNGAEKGLVAIVLDNGTFPGTGIVPRSFAGADASEVPSSASRFLHVVHQGGVDDRRVGVQVTFLKAV